MRLLAFRITNFRSIVDTGWCPFSSDNVTVLVGQNESGKSSILDALATTFSQESIEEDDCRISAPLPVISICISLDGEQMCKELDMNPPEQVEALASYFRERKNKIDFNFKWERNPKGHLLCTYDIDDGALAEMLRPFLEEAVTMGSLRKTEVEERRRQEREERESRGEEVESETGIPDAEAVEFLSLTDVTDTIFELAPLLTLFEEASGLLPNRIDVVLKEEKWQLTGDGAKAADNFLQIADIDLDTLIKGDARTQEYILRKANARLTEDFAQFWSQTIGKKEKLQLECKIANYGTDAAKKAGEPHLVFWISDGFNKLYPKQRSQGVRWFVSFYLQLKASQKRKGGQVFLLDEPGANLHAKAQSDVLNLINRLSSDVSLVYSTHSPTLLEYEKLYRVLAIQRDGEDGDSPTSVITAHKLGAASKDTLLPLFAAMGADLSQQQVIQKKNNVILEEISGFYYLKSVWHLTAQKHEAAFIAATGANNVESLANMFLGWGLEFIIVLDDDTTGRTVYNTIKRHMFGDDEDAAKQGMLKIPDCKGVEDLFAKDDFKKFVLDDGTDFDAINSQHVKDRALSKPVLAYQFWIKVSKGAVKLGDLQESTKEKFSNLAKEISSRLNPRPRK